MKKLPIALSLSSLMILAACGGSDKDPKVTNEPGLRLGPNSTKTDGGGTANTGVTTGSQTSTDTGTLTFTESLTSTHTGLTTGVLTLTATATATETGTLTPPSANYVGKNPYRFPIMRPSDGGTSAYSQLTGVSARAGQQVFVSWSGRYGTQGPSYRPIFGALFKIKYAPWNVSCDELDFAGRQSDGTQSINEGQPAGLRAAIWGSHQNFAIGSNGSFTADRDGEVIIGLNVPEMNGLCHRASTIQVSPGL